jgi:hypothetical protein
VHRRQVRYLAAIAAGAMASIYFLIGLGVLQVVDPGSAADAGTDMFVFGALAGAAFLLGAVLLLAFDRRALWIVGAIFQVLVFVMYVVVSQQRTPAFEVWGIALRIVQVPLFAALVYLALQREAHGSRVIRA